MDRRKVEYMWNVLYLCTYDVLCDRSLMVERIHLPVWRAISTIWFVSFFFCGLNSNRVLLVLKQFVVFAMWVFTLNSHVCVTITYTQTWSPAEPAEIAPQTQTHTVLANVMISQRTILLGIPIVQPHHHQLEAAQHQHCSKFGRITTLTPPAKTFMYMYTI